MRRREFLHTAVAAVTGAALRPRTTFGAQPSAAAARPLVLHLDRSHPGPLLAPDFTGLGYEISSVTHPGLLHPANSAYIELVRALGPTGVIRIGGNTSDFASFSPAGTPVSSPKGTVVTAQNLRDLRGFLDATGWQLIWGLNLGEAKTRAAIANSLDEAEAVARLIGPRLLAVEIGNEPDLFSIEHRPKPYPYEGFRRDYEPLRDALLKRLPSLPLAGPDVAGATEWVARFAADEPRNLRLLTHHYYREGQNPGSTAEKLLHDDPKLAPILEQLRAASRASGLPFRFCETNSFSGGGKPGVSDTHAQALWVLDYMLRLAAGGAAGVNIETGVNQLGFVSSYSPIVDNGAGCARTPGYFGMLAFANIRPGHLVPASLDSGPLNLVVYAVAHADGTTTLIAINREPEVPAFLQLPAPASPAVSVLRLLGPGLSSTTSFLDGWHLASEGGLRFGSHPPSPASGALLELPPASAALVRLGS